MVASGSLVSVYNVSYLNGIGIGTYARTLTEGSYYTDYEDVALYYQAFKALPGNYYDTSADSTSGYTTSKKMCYGLYGNVCRLYTKYYSRTDGYVSYLPELNTVSYFEADIGLDSSYASGTSWNRGTARLVIVPGGAKLYGSDPILFYTADHYESFRECYNYAEGWGPYFDGEDSTYGYGEWTEATTLTLQIAS
jgi:hypothetical protein